MRESKRGPYTVAEIAMWLRVFSAWNFSTFLEQVKPAEGNILQKEFQAIIVHLLIISYVLSFLKLCLNTQTLVWNLKIYMVFCIGWVELNCLFNVTINDISVIYVTAHRCAGGLKKKFDLRSGSQRHRHFVGFFNVPVQAPTRDHPFYTVIPTHRPI